MCQKEKRIETQLRFLEEKGQKLFDAHPRFKEKKFIILDDPEIKKMYTIALMWFNFDPDFAKQGKDFSLNKGLFFIGEKGTGKSFMMKLFSSMHDNPRPFKFVPVDDVRMSFNKNGDEGLLKYTDHSFDLKEIEESSTGQFGFDYGKQLMYCFDDIGTEEKGKFGTNTMSIVLSRMNHLHVDYGVINHFTSNCSTSKLKEVYGEVLFDRMLEMNNLIFVTKEKSMRG